MSESSKSERDVQGIPFAFWWTRPVTAHSHGKDYMDRVGKIGVASVMPRKIIGGLLNTVNIHLINLKSQARVVLLIMDGLRLAVPLIISEESSLASALHFLAEAVMSCFQNALSEMLVESVFCLFRMKCLPYTY